jgi:hypothetical protein
VSSYRAEVDDDEERRRKSFFAAGRVLRWKPGRRPAAVSAARARALEEEKDGFGGLVPGRAKNMGLNNWHKKPT